jgi:hypothetical protein
MLRRDEADDRRLWSNPASSDRTHRHVRDQQGELPDRGAPEPPSKALPADLVHLLIHRVGVGEDTVAGMTKDEAVARLQKYWTEGS